MKKIVLIMLVVFGLCRIAIGQNLTKIDVDLQEEMRLHGSNDLIRINIILNEQYNQTELRSKAALFPTKAAKRSFVINELKRFSQERQGDLLNSLDRYSKSAQISDIKSFWIANFINCYATLDAIEELSMRPDVRLIGFDKEENMLPEGEIATPADPSREIPYNVLKVQADAVWELGYTGEDIVVAVIDTGVNYNHEDLKTHMWEHPDYPYHGWNFSGNNNNPMDDNYYDGSTGHGSHCAGTVAGDGSAGSQTGMAPKAKIMAIKVLNYQGSGSVASMCAGVEFAVDKGADVLSMSIGKPNSSVAERIQYRTVMANTLEAGVVASVAAGNEYNALYFYPIPNNVRLPGSCPPPWLHPDQTLTGGLTAVVTIGATDSNDQIAYFSSHGPTTWQNIAGFEDYAYNPGMGLIRPDVCAPGVSIKSLVYNSNTGYATMSGTSMATPCVAGVMALMLSKNPELTPAEICEILQTTALPLSPTKNNTYGAGRINALDAINAIVTGTVVLESFSINDAQGNNDGKLNPGETVDFTISMKNNAEVAAENVTVTLSTDNENVIIVNNSIDFGNFDANEIKTIENAFSITLSDTAIANQEITFTLEATSETGKKTSTFDVLVYGYNIEILNTIIPESETLNPGETSDVWIYLKNTGNEPAGDITAKITTGSPYLIINDDMEFYGELHPNQYKYRVYNITIAPETPLKGTTELPFTMIITDGEGTETIINSIIHFSNTGDIPQSCNRVSNPFSETNGTTITLHWNAPQGAAPDKYFIYCDDIFLAETESTTYTHNEVAEGKHHYCIEALFPDGCTAFLSCFDAEVPCSIPDNLELKPISNSEIQLTWNAPHNDLIYNIYRNAQLLIANVEENTYIDSGLEPEVNYCYTIKSVCYGDLESEPSKENCLQIVGLNELTNDIKIYPNPANSAIFIEGEAIKTISLYNALGQLIEKQEVNGATTASINTSTYKSNVYIIEVLTEKGIKINRQIVVTH